MAKNDKFKAKPGGSKQKAEQKIRNPFEVHINRAKHDVVGRKRKEDRGLPGIARAKALKKREKTLLQEYKSRHKSNVFVDRRIGQNDPMMDPEKKMALRLAAVKIRQSNRKSLFNLNDDDQLTHRGIALDDDNLDDRLGFSDDEDDQVLDAQFVKDRHFGGGFLTKRDSDEGDNKDGDKPKSKKEWIEEIIVESKKKKADAKKEKEEQHEAVTKLDSELQTFLKMMSGKTITDEDKTNAKKNSEFLDYDKLVKELGFDRTGKAKTSSKLKSAEEVIKEEKEKLLLLEADRLCRMKGEILQPKQKSKSADDLDDGFTFSKADRFHLSYKDGEMIREDSEKNYEDERDEDEGNEEGNSEAEADEAEISDNDNEDDEMEGGDDLVGEMEGGDDLDGEIEGGDNLDGEMEVGDDLDGEIVGSDYDDESDQYSDIFDDVSDIDDDILGSKKEKNKNCIDPGKKKEIMEAARKEIPYVFEVPQDYDAFWALLEDRSPKEVNLILERMIACNHPSLGSNNKEKYEDVCAYILQTLNSVTEFDGDSPVLGVPPMSYVNSLVPHLYSIVQVCSAGVANAFRQVLEEKYEDCSKIGFKRYPMADCFVFLKVAGVLFPSSDFVHPVMTPVLSFLTQLLGQAKILTRRDIAAALFTANLMFEYLSVSKRYATELANILNGLLFINIPGKNKVKLPLNPPFKRFGPASELLVLEKGLEKFEVTKLTLAAVNEREKEITDEFRVTILCGTVKLLHQLCECWSELPSIKAIMEPTTKLLDALNLEKYPTCAKEAVDGLRYVIASLPKQRPALTKEAKKPKSLKMFEPAFEKITDGMKKHYANKDFQEKQKLLHKLKRERKGARREIQRDTAFLARQQLIETLKSDAERKRKVNQIMGALQTQESEHKKLKLKKY